MKPLAPIDLGGTSDGAPLLLFHGFMGEVADWAFLEAALRESHRLLGVNLPGHGDGWRGYPVETCDMARCADALNAHLDEMAVGACALLGYSMGGRFALYLACHFPERYPRVILESASPGLDTEEKRAARRAQDELLAERLAVVPAGSEAHRAFLDAWYALPLFETLHDRPAVLEDLIARRLARGNPQLLAQSLLALGTGAQPDLWPALADYRTPTLLLVGEEDRKFRIIAEDMCAACPAMAMEAFAGCGHTVHLENPEGFVTVVRSFLKPPGGAAPSQA